QSCVSTGGNRFRRGVQLFRDAGEDFEDKAAVAVVGAGLHRVDGRFSDGRGRAGDLDRGQQGGARVQAVAHRVEAGGDDPAEVGGTGVDDVEGHGGAEIDDDDGRLRTPLGHGGGVGEAVGADLRGIGEIDGDAEFDAVGEFDEGAARLRGDEGGDIRGD